MCILTRSKKRTKVNQISSNYVQGLQGKGKKMSQPIKSQGAIFADQLVRETQTWFKVLSI